MRFRRVWAEKMLGEVPEGSGADTLLGSRGFWQMLCEIPKGSDMFRCFLWHKHLIFMA